MSISPGWTPCGRRFSRWSRPRPMAEGATPDSSPANAQQALPLPNTYGVGRGLRLAGEQPGGQTAEETRERLQRLMDAGVRCFIDLTQPEELDPYDVDLPISVDYMRKP